MSNRFATLRGATLQQVETLAVPRSVAFVRVPTAGDAALDEVLTELAALPAAEATGDGAREHWPFVEVHVRLEAAERGLRARVEEVLVGRAARLARITVVGPAEPAHAPRVALAELDVRQMVIRKWEAEHGSAPPLDVLAALDEVVAAAAATIGDDDARRANALGGRSAPG